MGKNTLTTRAKCMFHREDLDGAMQGHTNCLSGVEALLKAKFNKDVNNSHDDFHEDAANNDVSLILG